MAFLGSLEGLLPRKTLEQYFVYFLIFGRLHGTLSQYLREGRSFGSLLKAQAVMQWGVLLLFYFSDGWMMAVNALVPQPYLDEVFHIPQALKYCESRYHEWDDKITTPPGLYALSVLYHRLWGYPCTTESLRHINCYGVLLIASAASACRKLIEGKLRGDGRASRPLSLYADHVSTNIALFPPLFFFSALYYTDVLSTLTVLAFYWNHLASTADREPRSSFFGGLFGVVLGTAALLMRQTNVFWVVVYMGGLEVVSVLRSLKPAPAERPEFTTLGGLIRFFFWRYSLGDIHDLPLDSAQPADWVFCALSIIIAAVCHPLRVLRQIWPQITIMGIFTAFVLWNGGVVLGDKSNHVATVHLAQMLYIWPLFAFFSAPLLGPPAYRLFFSRGRGLRTASGSPAVAGGAKQATPNTATRRSPALRMVEFFFRRAVTPLAMLSGAIFALAIVRCNTIIHPFTLADNRHYMFYVFRYTILRSIAVRFSLVGVYIVTAWLVWDRLAGRPTAYRSDGKPIIRSSGAETLELAINTPFPSPSIIQAPSNEQNLRKSPPQEHPADVNTADTAPAALAAGTLVTLDDPACASADSPPTSAALLWLLATALSLVTAPLVEPRYFILPWVFWRLLVPAWPTSGDDDGSGQLLPLLLRIPGASWVRRLGQRIDVAVALETVWFLLINAGTMYMFLFRPFVWRDGDGTILDSGRTQRFMW